MKNIILTFIVLFPIIAQSQKIQDSCRRAFLREFLYNTDTSINTNFIVASIDSCDGKGVEELIEVNSFIKFYCSLSPKDSKKNSLFLAANILYDDANFARCENNFVKGVKMRDDQIVTISKWTVPYFKNNFFDNKNELYFRYWGMRNEIIYFAFKNNIFIDFIGSKVFYREFKCP